MVTVNLVKKGWFTATFRLYVQLILLFLFITVKHYE